MHDAFDLSKYSTVKVIIVANAFIALQVVFWNHLLPRLFSWRASSLLGRIVTSAAAADMDAIAVSHLVPKTVTVVHRIEIPDLDPVKILALQSSLRTLCITTCVVVSISVIAGKLCLPTSLILGR